MRQSPPEILQVFPYLRVKDAPVAIEFYKRVFGATERFRLTEPSGRIGHIELDLGNMVLMLSEEFPEFGLLSAAIARCYRHGDASALRGCRRTRRARR